MAELKLDRNTQALFVAVVIMLLYFAFLYAAKSAVSPDEPFGHHMMNFASPLSGLTNVFAVALSLAAGAIIFLVLREAEVKGKSGVRDRDLEAITKAVAKMANRRGKDEDIEVIKKALAELLREKMEQEASPAQELKILKKALTIGEKKALAEVERSGEITQDSLRFRLGWSKAKVSAIVSNLDRMGVVQRERQGKTYRIFMQKK